MIFGCRINRMNLPFEATLCLGYIDQYIQVEEISKSSIAS